MIATFGNTLWFYFLPIYYTEVFGASPLLITTIYAIWSAIAALGSAPAGVLADKFGRKSIIVTSSLISAASVFVFAFSNIFLLSALALALAGLGSSFFKVTYTLVAESASFEKRGTAFGTFQALQSVASAASPIIGGFTISRNGYFPLFIIGGILTLLAAIARILFIRETLPRSLRRSGVIKALGVGEGQQESIELSSKDAPSFTTQFFSGFKKIVGHKALLSLVLIYSLYNLLVDQNSPITQLYANSALGLNVASIGILFSAILLVLAASRFIFGKLADKIGRKRTVLISWIGESTFVYIFVFAPRGYLGMALIGITFWMLFGVMDAPAINAWVAELFPNARHRGFYMGVFYSATVIPTVPALILSGYLFSIQPQLPFYANSALGVIALLLLIGLKEPTNHELE